MLSWIAPLTLFPAFHHLSGLKGFDAALSKAVADAGEEKVTVGLDSEWRLPRWTCSTLQVAFGRLAFVMDTWLDGMEEQRQSSYAREV